MFLQGLWTSQVVSWRTTVYPISWNAMEFRCAGATRCFCDASRLLQGGPKIFLHALIIICVIYVVYRFTSF